jgi:hypothetical protein
MRSKNKFIGSTESGNGNECPSVLPVGHRRSNQMETFQGIARGAITNVGVTAHELASSVPAGISLCQTSCWIDAQRPAVRPVGLLKFSSAKRA